MKKAYWIALIVAAVGGTALHFLYALLPNAVTALIAPVNESVWEHLKLLFWPTLAAALVLSFRAKDRPRLWSGFLIALLAMPAALLTAYYGLRAIGVEGLAVDIALYYLTMAGGFYLAWRLRRSERAAALGGIALMLVMLYGTALILFTFAAPPLEIFRSPV